MKNFKLPELFRVGQNFSSYQLTDIEAAVRETVLPALRRSSVRSGQSVAIAVGSRGIRNLSRIIAEVVRGVKSLGGAPQIVPAMGSHGGATADGQAKVLAGFGITAGAIGCPVISSMETIQVGSLPGGLPVVCDAICAASDHVIVVNRVKPHTRLHGNIQSGLVKMLLIGLGKQRGAQAYHEMFALQDYTLTGVAPLAVPILLENVPIRFGLAIIEDAFEQTAHVEAIAADQLLEVEPELQARAASWMPALPFSTADLLIIDQMGKEISGTGMDTNVIGRKWHDKLPGPGETPHVDQIYVRGLTKKTSGNACGIGIAEFCRSDLVQQIDVESTRVNCLTGRHVSAAAIPMHFKTDLEVLSAAMSQCRHQDPTTTPWMWIRDTLHLETVMCSKALWHTAQRREDLEIRSACQPLRFDRNDQLLPAF